jgi:trans-AT polyketide synthase, acyltransferase and oxidoreductase domains
MSTVWLYPGQGSQTKGMGQELFDRYPGLVGQADEILGYSVRAQCLDGAEPGLNDTRYVQPALFVVCALGHLARAEDHRLPDFLAGHSLGEYAALFAGGSFDFTTGVRLVQRRGELMGRAGGGGMLAVVRLDAARLTAVLAEAGLHDLDQANRNSADQLVLSGPAGSLTRAAAVIRAAGGRTVPLRVSAPFHSRYMAEAATAFGKFLRDVAICDPRIPVIANVTGLPYPPSQVKDHLRRQIVSPVRWWESMSWLIGHEVTDAVEIGPGQVLTGLWGAARRHPADAVPAPPPPRSAGTAAPEARLGSAQFRDDYGVRYAYLAGSMYHGIASVPMVIRLGQAGLMGFFGAGGLAIHEIDTAIRAIRGELGPAGRFGMNLLATPGNPAAEQEIAALYLRHDIRYIEAAGYTGITAALVQLRFSGAGPAPDGTPRLRHILAKVSRPEVAAAFMGPAPEALLRALVAAGALTAAEARLARDWPVAGEVCVEADSGGHTDAGNPYALMPAIIRLRDQVMKDRGYARPIQIGAAGGVGSPEAVAAAFVLGADFVLTGSVNQCSPEAGTSDEVKELLSGLGVQDTAYAPAGDMFELGARVQVVRKSTLFAARANKLYELYRRYDSLDDIDAATRTMIEQRYFRRTFDQVWAETREHLRKERSEELARAECQPKVKMALVFRWYFAHTSRIALDGDVSEQVNFQIHCGPALGVFNQCVAGTPLSGWRARHVDLIADLLMTGAARHLARVTDHDPRG